MPSGLGNPFLDALPDSALEEAKQKARKALAEEVRHVDGEEDRRRLLGRIDEWLSITEDPEEVNRLLDSRLECMWQ